MLTQLPTLWFFHSITYKLAAVNPIEYSTRYYRRFEAGVSATRATEIAVDYSPSSMYRSSRWTTVTRSYACPTDERVSTNRLACLGYSQLFLRD